MYFKQIQEIINGSKTQTRRSWRWGEYANDIDGNPVVTTDGRRISDKPIHTVYTAGGRIKWQVGRDYAISPGRCKPGVWWHSVAKIWRTEKPEMADKSLFWKPLRHTIKEIRFQPVQDISRQDTIDEGIWLEGECWRSKWSRPGDCISDPRGEYRRIWDSINNRAGMRWSDNPLVWSLTFEVYDGKN